MCNILHLQSLSFPPSAVANDVIKTYAVDNSQCLLALTSDHFSHSWIVIDPSKLSDATKEFLQWVLVEVSTQEVV